MFDAYAKGFRGKPFLAVEVRLQSLLSKFALQHQSARLRALDWGGEVRVGGGGGGGCQPTFAGTGEFFFSDRGVE